MSSLADKLTTLPLNFSLTLSNQAGTGLAAFSSILTFNVPLSFLLSLTVITSPTFTKYDGISTLLPFTSNCPWFTNCLACALDVPNPNLYTTLSNLLYNICNKFSPVTPFLFEAISKYFLNCFSPTP